MVLSLYFCFQLYYQLHGVKIWSDWRHEPGVTGIPFSHSDQWAYKPFSYEIHQGKTPPPSTQKKDLQHLVHIGDTDSLPGGDMSSRGCLRNLSNRCRFSLAEIRRLVFLSLWVGLSLSMLDVTAVALNGGLVLELGWDKMVAETNHQSNIAVSVIICFDDQNLIKPQVFY